MLNSDLYLGTKSTVTKSISAPDRHILTELSINAVSLRRCHRVVAMPIFAEATATAARITDAPVAILIAIAESGDRISSLWGLDKFTQLDPTANLDRELAGLEYCHAKTIGSGDKFAVANFRVEPQLAHSPLYSTHQVQAFLGVPIVTAAQDILGTLAILDFQPRQFSNRDVDLLTLVSRLVASEFERRLLSQEQLSQWVGELKQPQTVQGFDNSQATIEHDLVPDARQVNRDNGRSSQGFDDSQATIEHDLVSDARQVDRDNGGSSTAIQVCEHRDFNQLLAHLSQQLRTPLTSVLGMTSVLQQEIYGALSTKQKDYLAIVYHSSQQLVTLVDEILALNESQQPQPDRSLKCVDLEMLCRLAIQHLMPSVQSKHQQIILDLAGANTAELDELDLVLGLNKDRLRQIIYYLGLSLSDRTDCHHQIAIHLDLSNGLQLQMLTSDEQVTLALDASDSDKSTCPTEQENEQSLKIRLGLALSQSMAIVHGGTIEIITNGLGYQLRLPLCDRSGVDRI